MQFAGEEICGSMKCILRRIKGKLDRVVADFREKRIQDSFDLTQLRKSKQVVVFFLPLTKINGGVMSIYSLASLSREVLPNACVLLCTETITRSTYAHNDYFPNDENIYRWPQIAKNLSNCEDLVLHLPEYLSKGFYRSLTHRQITILRRIERVRINILNQNILLMPPKEEFKDLYLISDHITQTTAHLKYATQEHSDNLGLPTMRVGVYINSKAEMQRNFDQKENIVVYSPDKHLMKPRILGKLRKEFPDYQLVEVNNMKYGAYLDLVSRARFSITFGEGMDGYFSKPLANGSLSFAVYNNVFFPPAVDWMKLDNIFCCYEDMLDGLAAKMRRFSQDQVAYEGAVQQALAALKSLRGDRPRRDLVKENLSRFYAGKFEFYPNV